MRFLRFKKIIFIVSGGIAAYKAPDIIRKLKKEGAEIKVVLTDSAKEFVTELTFQAVSGNSVFSDIFNDEIRSGMSHIELARWCDAVVVAPATADFISNLASGRANNLASTICLATDQKILICPAMNRLMWENQLTRDNVSTLKKRGFDFLGPFDGEQACGESGPGRLADVDTFPQAVSRLFSSGDLSGVGVLVTAGPTHEAIDPVRYIANKSSGLMGYSIAIAARELGASVTLISGPTHLDPPERVKVISVITASEMLSAVLHNLSANNIVISAAAVADYRIDVASKTKIKKSDAIQTIKLVKTVDIIKEVGRSEEKPFTIGFAAETELLEENSKSKLIDKNLDMVVGNLVGDNIGFGDTENKLTVFWEGGSAVIEKASKPSLGRKLMSIIADRFQSKNDDSRKTTVEK